MSDVRVQFEAAMLGHNWRDRVRITRTPLVDNLIEAGKLTVLEEIEPEDDAEPEAAGPVVLPAADEPPAGPARGWFAAEPED